ncbi:MAG TPA: autotransporter domain-containing protein [Herbaspirillum sp.]|jgi:probable HAF family extracellular repeat protein
MKTPRSLHLSFSKQNAVFFALMSLAPFAVADDIVDIDGLGGNSSVALGISADGKVVVGTAVNSTASIVAFRWTQESGMQDLGVAGGSANGVNADGSVVVGEFTVGANVKAFRWVGGVVTDLGTLGGASAAANAVNADGSVVVGGSNNGTFDRAFRWSAGTGVMSDLGTLGGNTSEAYAVSDDGTVVAGRAQDGAALNKAFRWTAGIMTNLGTLGGATSAALSINGDGSVVVGEAQDAASNNLAFRWTAATSMVSLGTLGGITSSAAGVSNDGSVVVGAAQNAGGSTSAFRWTQAGGMLSVEQWLRNSGVSVPADVTLSATGVSADGSIVTGVLMNSHAFIARGRSGMIDTAQFNQSLAAGTGVMALAIQNEALIMQGVHDNPMRALLPDGRASFWASGNIGRDNHADRDGDIGVGEIGMSRNIGGDVQLGIAIGQIYNKADTAFNGRSRIESTYILPELTTRLGETSLYATISALYANGTADIDRGYENSGMTVQSRGSANVENMAAQIRLDWRNAWALGKTAFTPYTSLMYDRTKLGAYTESGGGFPASWDRNVSTATTARVGLDAVLALNDHLNLLGRIEGTHRFPVQDNNASGEVIGLYSFNFAGDSTEQNWARIGAGLESIVGNSKTSVTLNATTQGDVPSYWLGVSYRLQF